MLGAKPQEDTVVFSSGDECDLISVMDMVIGRRRTIKVMCQYHLPFSCLIKTAVLTISEVDFQMIKNEHSTGSVMDRK